MASTAFQGPGSTSPNYPSLVTQTLAYASSNVTQSTVPYHQPRVWVYASSFTGAEVGSSLFFGANAAALGFRLGDVLQVSQGASMTFYRVAINPTSSGFVTFTGSTYYGF